MTERDEVHAQLIALRVFHLQEMEQIGKKRELKGEIIFD